MTINDALISRRRYTVPYPDLASRSLPLRTTSGEWDSHVDTLPLLCTGDVRIKERLHGVRECARQGMAEIDAALARSWTPDGKGTR